MTPAERVILRVLAEEYRRHGPRVPGSLGPYGRAGRRLNIDPYRVWDVEETCVRIMPEGGSGVAQAEVIEATLA